MVAVDLVILLVFLLILAKSSENVINSSLKISKFFGISNLAMGFLLVSAATSLPEFSVSVISSSAGEGAISLGNVFGSNIADILLILGAVAVIYGLKIKKKEFEIISPILIVCSIVAFGLLFLSTVERIIGFVLIGVYILYAYYIIKKRVSLEGNNNVTKGEAARAFSLFFISIMVVLFSSSIIVESAVNLADGLGVARGFIGATIIALGTSLPELSVEIQAVRKKKYGLAIGDAIGSVMTNTTLVLGSAAVLQPIFFDVNIAHVYLLFNIIACLTLFYILKTSEWIGREKGIMLVLLYVIYLLVLVYTQISIIE